MLHLIIIVHIKQTGQTEKDYYIHKKEDWTDAKVRKFRRNIRRHNICMRHEVDYHSTILERKKYLKTYPKRQKQKNISKNELTMKLKNKLLKN